MTTKTVLFDLHQQLGAKIVDFAGWQMPLHYGSQIKEHGYVREDAGFFDVSHMQVIDISGSDCVKFLSYLLANDIAKLTTQGKALYSCMLNPAGGVVDDLIVYRLTDTYRIILNASVDGANLTWLQTQATAFNVNIVAQTDLSIIAIQGKNAREKTIPLLPTALQQPAKNLTPFFATDIIDNYCIARTGYTGEDGFEVMLPIDKTVNFVKALVESGVMPCGLGARDSLRLEAGMNLCGVDMDAEHSPLVSGLSWTVAFQPEQRDFIGRNALIQQQTNGIQQKLIGLILTSRGVLRNDLAVFQQDKCVGKITSGGFSPTLKHSIAFARIDADTTEKTQALTVEMRGKHLPVKSVKLPFIRHGRACF